MNKELELRMYFFVPYNISPIQQAIQAGHAALEYANTYGHTKLFDEFVENHKTWIILNGGTTNNKKDLDGYLGTLNQIGRELIDNEISCSFFYEPDLNDALTAVCFIVDERVFNYDEYPNFIDWLLDIKMTEEGKKEAKINNPELWVKLKLHPDLQQEMFPEYYKEWVEFLGGEKNVFLRELIKNKKLA